MADAAAPSDNEKLITAVYKYFRGQGFPPPAAAAMTGSLLRESGLDPTIKQEKGGPGRGLAQWTDDPKHNSWKAEQAFAKKNNLDPNSIAAQLRFILNQNEDVTDQFKAADTPELAQAAVLNFERPGVVGDRFDNADAISKNVAAGLAPGTGLGGKILSKDPSGLLADLKTAFKLTPDWSTKTPCQKPSQAKDAPAEASVSGKLLNAAPNLKNINTP